MWIVMWLISLAIERKFVISDVLKLNVFLILRSGTMCRALLAAPWHGRKTTSAKCKAGSATQHWTGRSCCCCSLQTWVSWGYRGKVDYILTILYLPLWHTNLLSFLYKYLFIWLEIAEGRNKLEVTGSVTKLVHWNLFVCTLQVGSSEGWI